MDADQARDGRKGGPIKVVITGGAGFIDSNAASRYLKRGADVGVLDDFAAHADADLVHLAGELTPLLSCESRGPMSYVG